MNIRPFKEEDRKVMQKIYLNGRIATFNWVDISSYTLEDFDAATAGEQILVAEDQSILAGFIAFYPQESFIHHLYVDAHYHKKGIGKALLNAAVVMLHQPVRLKCLVKNKSAVTFYKSQGWKFEMTGDDVMGRYYLLVNS
ncbi:GNAT family N-acetyltransferase [Pedobacter sp. L105]|uniref:GNAT family N-acetyltransferase n=1 Tax=Pedobacter sp. L105 TaxID=1641871 RepID=UPI00131B0603|nr:GNAT family N-acetyltransferase [Pedobacter sp. L105]